MAGVGGSRWWIGPLLGSVASLILLILLEGGARAFVDAADIPFPQPVAPGQRACVSPHLSRGYAPIPGACGYNDLGYLGALPQTATSREHKGPLTILLLGDSIGAMTLWVSALETGLGEALGRDVIIYNSAVSGYNACQEWMTLRDLAPITQPDVILLQSCTNDVAGSLVLLPSEGGSLRLELGDGSALRLPGFILHSTLLTYMAVRYGASHRAEKLEGRQPGDAARCLAGIRDEANRLKRPVHMLLFPELVSAGDPRFEAAIENETLMAEWAEVFDIPVIKLRPALEAAGAMSDFRPGEFDLIHPNEAGQRVAALALVEALSPSLRAMP